MVLLLGAKHGARHGRGARKIKCNHSSPDNKGRGKAAPALRPLPKDEAAPIWQAAQTEIAALGI